MSSVPAHMAGSGAEPAKMDAIWERQQIRAFTAWCNSHLRKRDLKIDDIKTGFADGKMLLQMMEVVGDVKLAKPARGKMKIHAIQNINACLDFIKGKGVRLVGIGAEEVVDEELKLILGMVWTIILRFDIQDISEDEMSAKDALLLWCQRKTKGYRDVNVTNFHKSWQSGLAFCALIHRHRPDLIDFDSLDKADAVGNLRLALDVADKHLDIAQMIDPEDIVASIKPDERSIMTQVAAFYKCFASFNKNEVAASKIATVLKMNQENEKLIQEFELMASQLLEWIPSALQRLNDRPALNSVAGCLDVLKSFEPFRTDEYPAKLQEKALLSAHYSSLQTKLRLSGRSPYEPTEGKMIQDIEAAWGSVNGADGENRTWVVSELHRNKLCEQKAAVFASKCQAHEAWVLGASQMLSEDDFSFANLGSLQAKVKKHAAFTSELEAKKTGVFDIGTRANELDDQNFCDKDGVNQRYADIYAAWEEVEQLSVNREANLHQSIENQKQLEEIWLETAMAAAPLSAELDNLIDSLSAAIFTDSAADVEALQTELDEIAATGLLEFDQGFAAYQALGDKAAALIPDARASTPDGHDRGSMVTLDNPYTIHTREAIAAKYGQVQSLIPERTKLIGVEREKQAGREQLKIQWAEAAAASEAYLQGLSAKVSTIDADQATALETQLERLASVTEETAAYSIGELEALAGELEAKVIFDNPHSTVTIEQIRGSQQGVHLFIGTVETSVKNQILTRDATNITEEQMDEYRSSFNHFDKDKSGHLDKLEFRGCLLSLGVDIPSVAAGDDAEFIRIWKLVDPNGDNAATFGEFVNFMAEERADAATKDDLLQQFELLSGGNPYILPNQMNDLEPELISYCVENMAPYDGGPEGALDYVSFAAAAFGEETAI